MEVLKKYKDETLSTSLLRSPVPVLIVKSVCMERGTALVLEYEFVITGHMHESDHEVIQFMCCLVSAKSANNCSS